MAADAPNHAPLLREFFALAKAHEWSQKQMAAALQVHQTTVSKHQRNVESDPDAEIRLNDTTVPRLEAAVRRLKDAALLTEYERGVRDALEIYREAGERVASMLPRGSDEEIRRRVRDAEEAVARIRGEERDEAGRDAG